MGKRTRAYAAQGYLFNDELEGRAVKEPEEPKKMVVFPVTEFSQKEQAAREHIRRRREMAAAPSTPKAELRPDPLPKRVAGRRGSKPETPPPRAPSARPKSSARGFKRMRRRYPMSLPNSKSAAQSRQA